MHSPCICARYWKKEVGWKSIATTHASSATNYSARFCATSQALTAKSLAAALRTLLPDKPELLIVENALTDARFCRNPLVVGPPDIRFYAGCPLVASNGMRLGSLCIIDRAPRTFDAEACNVLANMAEMVVREIEKDQVMENNAQRTAMLSQVGPYAIAAFFVLVVSLFVIVHGSAALYYF